MIWNPPVETIFFINGEFQVPCPVPFISWKKPSFGFLLKVAKPQAYDEPADNGGRPLTGWRIQRAAGQSLSFRGVGPLFLGWEMMTG